MLIHTGDARLILADHKNGTNANRHEVGREWQAITESRDLNHVLGKPNPGKFYYV